ncbi:MAG: hypothetical protein ACREPB_09620 [Arenimonas sp.]
MTSNNALRFLMVCMVCTVLGSCKKDKLENAEDMSEKADPLAMEAELNILALEGRVESGKDSAAFDWVTPFEVATGCKVKAVFLGSNDLFASNLQTNKYDLVIAEESFLPADVFQEIDFSRLRAFKNLDQRFIQGSVLKNKLALPLHWKQVQPVPPSTEIITEVESTHLLAKTKNPNCAYAWMEWTLSPKVQADIAAALDTIPVIPAACVGNELLGDEACKQRMAESSAGNLPHP